MDEWKRRALGYLPFQKGEKSKTVEGNFQHPAQKMGSVPKDDYGLLKWKDYHVTVASTFKMLKDEEDFLDVTLVCDEESQISAHKVLCENKEHVLFRNHFKKEMWSEAFAGDAVGMLSLLPGNAPKVKEPSPSNSNA